jgi:hypothetical protein
MVLDSFFLNVANSPQMRGGATSDIGILRSLLRALSDGACDKNATVGGNRAISALTVCGAFEQSGIFTLMAQSARQVLVTLLAFVVVVGAWGRFTPGCSEELPIAQAETHESHAGHHHHGNHHPPAKQPVSAPACLKCCGICIADPGLTRAPAIVVDLSGSPVVFFIASKTYKDHSFYIDPGIPKPVA